MFLRRALFERNRASLEAESREVKVSGLSILTCSAGYTCVQFSAKLSSDMSYQMTPHAIWTRTLNIADERASIVVVSSSGRRFTRRETFSGPRRSDGSLKTMHICDELLTFPERPKVESSLAIRGCVVFSKRRKQALIQVGPFHALLSAVSTQEHDSTH